MKFTKALKPTLWKVIVSVVLTLVYVLIINWFISNNIQCGTCEPGAFTNCADYSNFLILDFCSCDCTTLFQVLWQYVYLIIIPLVVVYFIYSLIQYLFPKK